MNAKICISCSSHTKSGPCRQGLVRLPGERKSRVKNRIKIIAATIACCLLVLLILPANTVQAANVSKKTVTVTIDQENPYRSFKFSLKKNSSVRFSIKILSVSGEMEEDSTAWGYYGTSKGKGSLFYDLKKSSLKKNEVLDSLGNINGSGGVTFDLPRGVESIKIKVTIYSADNKKTIKSFKETNTMY